MSNLEKNSVCDQKMPADMGNLTLFKHQIAGVKFLLHHHRAVLGYAVGLGKTPIALTSANILIDQHIVNRFAIIAPASIKYQWQSEIEKFSNRKAVVLDNSTSKRLEQSFKDAENADFVITNYEMLRNKEYAEKIKKLASDAVIADEAHKIKNDSQQTRAFQSVFENAEVKWLLTATPFPNGQAKETFTMLSHVTNELGNWFKFANKYVVSQTINVRGRSIWKPVALKNLDDLRNKLFEVVIIRNHNSDDVNSSLPKNRYITHELTMETKQAKIYEAMRFDMMKELSVMNFDTLKKNASSILAKLKRLEQIAIDPDQLLQEKDVDWKKLYPKEEWVFDTTIDHLNNAENRGMVVFCETKLPLKKLELAFKRQGIKIGFVNGEVDAKTRNDIVNKFNQNQIQVILTTSAGEEGLNLQHNSHTMIHLDTPWVPKSVTQREGRILRTGQPNAFTLFYNPVMKNTIETVKRAKLAKKVQDIEKILGTGSAGSVGKNVSAQSGSWTKKDIFDMLKA